LAGEIRLPRRGRGLYDFRPGLPLEQFWAVYVRGRGPGEADRAVNHVEQMYASRCFQGSAGSLGCISCHDPHVAVGPRQRVSHYRDRCLACHQEQSCSLSPAGRRQTRPDDSCIDCHMPRYPAGDIAHAAATDHRILRCAAGEVTLPARAGPAPSLPAPAVVSFYRDHFDPHDPEAARDLAVALVQLTFHGKISELAYPESLLPLLDQAVRRDPDDVEAGEARAGLLQLQWKYPEALAAFEVVLARRPRRERSLSQAAHVAQKLRRRETARRYWEQAAAVNPWMPTYPKSLALLLAEEQAWEQCGRQCEAWLRLDPADAEARALWVKSLASTGRLEEARGELARLERLHAPSIAELRRWLVERPPGRPAGRGGAER
jgi:predicted CXXCH cytochrome family protein